MIMLIYFAFVVASIVLTVYLVFVELPNAAVDVARNNLFALRANLFKVAQEGRISFESRTYQMHRELLNGLIRYSHDISFMHMRYSQLITPRSSVEFARAIRKRMESDLHAQPAAIRKELEKIIEAAHTQMVMLMVNRSIFSTLWVRGRWVAYVLATMCVRCAESFRVAKAERPQITSPRRQSRPKNDEASLKNEPVAVELVPSFKRARAKMSSSIDRNAWGYLHAGSQDLLAAA